MFIGFEGSGCDIELKSLAETDKAFYVEDDMGNKMWLPKSAFDESGILNDYGQRLYEENV